MDDDIITIGYEDRDCVIGYEDRDYIIGDEYSEGSDENV